MSASLKQIFDIEAKDFQKIYNIPGDTDLDILIYVAEKYAAEGKFIEPDMYFIRDNHDLFIAKLRETVKYHLFSMAKNLRQAMKYTRAHNSEIIIKAINELILEEEINKAIELRNTYEISDTILFNGVSQYLRPICFLKQFNNPKIFIDYALVYNLNAPGVIFTSKKRSEYDVFDLFYLFFENVKTDTLTIVDRYFEIYDITKHRYWFVYSLIILYSKQNGYSDDYIQNYITNHGSNVEKADLVMLIFMIVTFKDDNMLKFLVNEYNRIYPDQKDELYEGMIYCISQVFMVYMYTRMKINMEHITIYSESTVPEYLDYKIYNDLLDITRIYFRDLTEPSPEMQRMITNNNYMNHIKEIIYSDS